MATSILLAKIWSESFIGIGTVPNAGSWRPEGLVVPDFGGLPACWGDSALMISKPGQQTSGTYGSMGSRARAGVLIAIPSGVSGNIFLLPPLEWVMAHRDRKKRSLAQGGVMLWFGLLAKMSWQNETSALPYTHPEPWMVFWEYTYAPHRETSTGPPKTGGFKNVLEWVVLPSHSSYKILCHAIQG